MLNFNLLHNKIVKINRFLLVLFIGFLWIFSGWLQIFNFLPKIEIVEATTTSNIHASAYTNTTGFDNNFSNAANAYSSNDSYATVTDSRPRNKEFATNFRGFDFSTIPTGSTINSVTAYIEKKSSASNTSGEWRTSMWENVTVSAALSPGVTGAIGNLQYTSPSTNTTDAYWSQSWATLPTLSQLKATNFGLRVQISQGGNSTVYTYSIDDIYIVVNYTEPNESPTVVLNSPIDTATEISKTPQLLFTGTDTDSDEIEYEVQVDTVNTFDSEVGSIDIGLDAGDLGADGISGLTGIFLNNPANTSGTITNINIYLRGAVTGLKIGTFYGSGSSYTLRDYNTIGSLGVGIHELTGLNINVQSGDFIGAYYTTGLLSVATSGYAGIYGKSGDSFIESGPQSYTLQSGYGGSIYGFSSDALIKKLSSVPDTGFTTGHPFGSTEQVTYTIQAGDELDPETEYFWRVRAIDPTPGSNTFGAWSTTRSFTTMADVVTVDTPVFTDATGTYNNDLSETITVASPASSVICYTTDGSTPTADTPGTCTNGTTYSGAINITVTGTTLKAIGTKAGYINSAVKSETYTLQVANPTFGTNGGSFNNNTTSTQTSTTTGAVFCQTVDGTTNPEASTAGVCFVGTTGADATVIATGKTIKALGTKANYINSAVQTSNTFTLTVGAVTSSPGPDTYFGMQSVTLSIDTTTGATLHYTIDGGAVTCASPTYSGAFDVAVTTTVKAIGCKANYVDSAAISDLYVISFSTSIEIRAQDYTTSVSNIIFPKGEPGTTVLHPYNNIDGAVSPQVFGGAGTAKPAVTLYNGGGTTLMIWYNITTFNNGVVSNEYYLTNAKAGSCLDASYITNAVTFDEDTSTGTTITPGVGNEKDFYLKTTLSSLFGKSGTSTLTILGEAL